jgi:hypothetical protein
MVGYQQQWSDDYLRLRYLNQEKCWYNGDSKFFLGYIPNKKIITKKELMGCDYLMLNFHKLHQNSKFSNWEIG